MKPLLGLAYGIYAGLMAAGYLLILFGVGFALIFREAIAERWQAVKNRFRLGRVTSKRAAQLIASRPLTATWDLDGPVLFVPESSKRRPPDAAQEPPQPASMTPANIVDFPVEIARRRRARPDRLASSGRKVLPFPLGRRRPTADHSNLT